jgi:hypothetical protein
MATQASSLPQVASRQVKIGRSILPPTWGPAKMTLQGPATSHVTRGEGRGEDSPLFQIIYN